MEGTGKESSRVLRVSWKPLGEFLHYIEFRLTTTFEQGLFVLGTLYCAIKKQKNSDKCIRGVT